MIQKQHPALILVLVVSGSHDWRESEKKPTVSDSSLAGATVTLATHTSDGCCLTKWDSDNRNGSFYWCYPALWVSRDVRAIL